MTTYTVTRVYYRGHDAHPRDESVMFDIDDVFQVQIGRGKFIGMTNQQVEDRIQADCEWWDAKVNETDTPYEPTAGFNNRMATFVDDEFTV